MTLLQRQHNLPGLFYIDTWPITVPMLIITEPSIAAQVTQKPSLPRHSLVKEALRNLTGPRSIFDTNGQEWKSLRSLFNPGFASTHLNALVPGIADHVMVFHSKLLAHARKGDVFPVENMVTSLTLDVIGQVVLGQNLDSQNGNSPIADTFRKGVNTQWSHMDLIGKMKGIPMLWWYCRRLDKLIGEAVKDRYQKRQFEEKIAVIDLALQAYNEEKLNRGDTKTNTDQIDPEFLKVAVDNVKTFILGGHDTTASTISYCYYNLWKHQDILKDLRAEHDSVFDPDSAKTLEILKQDPRKLGALPLTTAVIKETLRLFPPGSSFRESAKGYAYTIPHSLPSTLSQLTAQPSHIMAANTQSTATL
jgi:cytochrome P450